MKLFLLCVLFTVTIWADGFINKENIVIDSTNHLMWQDDQENIDHKENHIMTQIYCDDLILNGYINWRVPTLKEFLSIVDVKNKKIAIDKTFQFVKQFEYFSNTQFVHNTNQFWSIDFATGAIKTEDKNKENYVRCVRDMR